MLMNLNTKRQKMPKWMISISIWIDRWIKWHTRKSKSNQRNRFLQMSFIIPIMISLAKRVLTHQKIKLISCWTSHILMRTQCCPPRWLVRWERKQQMHQQRHQHEWGAQRVFRQQPPQNRFEKVKNRFQLKVHPADHPCTICNCRSRAIWQTRARLTKQNQHVSTAMFAR